MTDKFEERIKNFLKSNSESPAWDVLDKLTRTPDEDESLRISLWRLINRQRVLLNPGDRTLSWKETDEERQRVRIQEDDYFS